MVSRGKAFHVYEVPRYERRFVCLLQTRNVDSTEGGGVNLSTVFKTNHSANQEGECLQQQRELVVDVLTLGGGSNVPEDE